MARSELTLSVVGDRIAIRRGRLVDVAAIGLACAATLLLVVPYFLRRPFWFDELVSLEVAALSPADLGAYVFGQEANMALYHAVLGLLLRVADGEAAVRGLSVVFALLTLPLLYALARRLFDRRVAIIAVLLMSVNVSFVGYARDGRSYALALLLTTASSLFLVQAGENARRLDWALYVATAGLAVWAHLIAGLVVVAQVAWLFLVRGPAPRRDATVSVLVLALVVAPLGLAILIGGQQAQLDWLARPGPLELPGLFEWFVESRLTVVVYLAGAAAAVVAALADWRRQRRWPLRESLLLLWLLVPPVVAFLASFATPLYLYRYFLVCLPALVLLVAAGFARMPPAWLGLGLAAVAIVLSLRTVASCQPDCKIRHDDWQAAAAYLDERARPGDAVVAYPAVVRTPLDHYLGAKRPELLYPSSWRIDAAGSESSSDVATAVNETQRGRRVWLVTWWLPAREAREALARRGSLVAARNFAGNVRIALYEASR